MKIQSEKGMAMDAKQVKDIAIDYCRSKSRVYKYEDRGYLNDVGYMIIIATFVRMGGKETEFQVNINIFPDENSIKFLVPLYETNQGLVGEKIGALYQYVAEARSVIASNVSLGVYPFDGTNQLILHLHGDIDMVDRKWFDKRVEELYDTFIYFRPRLDALISFAELKFEQNARAKGYYHQLLDIIKRLN